MDVNKKQEIVTKDGTGKIIKKVVKYFESVPCPDGVNCDDPAIGLEVAKNAGIIKVEVYERRQSDGKFMCNEYTDQDEIEKILMAKN